MVTIQISKGALVASMVAVSVSIYTLSFSQLRRVNQSPAAVSAKGNNAMIKQLTDPMFILKGRVDDLELNVANLTKALKKSQDDLKTSQTEIATLQSLNKPPKGYTVMYITRANLDHVEGSALMKFFVRY